MSWNESFGGEIQNAVPALRLAAICACVGILVAGLWPFHAPRNEVSWLSQGNGLLFGRHGSIVSAGTFEAPPKTDGSCSLEIWLEPSRVDSGGTILAFYRPISRMVPFAMLQFVDGLELQRSGRDQLAEGSRLFVDKVFSRLEPIFLSISSGGEGTKIYVDGVLIKRSEAFRFSSEDLTGQFIIGNAPASSNNWSGQMKGLAVYDRELQAGEVSNHFAARSKSAVSGLSKSKGVVASYRFMEGKGNIVYNQEDSSPNLLIPERYFMLREPLLEPPWREFHSRWSYWLDFGINIAGFIPFGLVLHAYFSAIGIKRATWLSIVLGFALSLTVEVLQAFLPTRNSGMNDLITNTVGTALGAILWARRGTRDWVSASAGFLRSRV